MLDDLIKKIRREASGEMTMSEIHSINNIERKFDYPSFAASAEYVCKRLKSIGAANTEIINLKADGKTLYGAWRAPMAWEAKSARLEVVSPGAMSNRIIADYEQVPCSLVMWSGPTPKDGIIAELVEVGSGGVNDDYKGKNVKGKIVLTNRRASVAKGMAEKYGAIGVVSDWNTHPDELPHDIFWNNTFPDYPDGWGPTDTDSRIFGFAISPATGREIRCLLAKGEKILLRAKADTKIYKGKLPITTGIIRGTSQKEILALGHGSEQGACDNASGVACMLEAMRILAKLIKNDIIPKPKRNIRMLMTNECYGTLGYVHKYPERVARTVAGICVDSPALDTELPGSKLIIHRCPESAPGCIDDFSVILAKKIFGTNSVTPWDVGSYSMTDNLIAHPNIGIPTTYLGKGGRDLIWHTSADRICRINTEQLEESVIYTTAYLYYLACAEDAEAEFFARRSAIEAEYKFNCRLLEIENGRGEDFAGTDSLREKLEYELSVLERRIADAARFASSKNTSDAINQIRLGFALSALEKLETLLPCAEPNKKSSTKYDRIIPEPVYLGPLTLDPIPIKERKGHDDFRWGGPVFDAIQWCDSKRSIANVVRIVETARGKKLPGLAKELEWLLAKGLLRDAAKSK